MKEAGIKGEDVDLVYMGNCLPAGQGQAPARQAGIKAGLPKGARGHHHQQDVRLGPAGGGDGPQRHPRRRSQRRRRRRHGEHDERAAPRRSAQGSQVRRGQHCSDHMAPDGLEDAYAGRRDGHLRRHDRQGISVHPRTAGRLRARDAEPRADAPPRKAASSARFRRSTVERQEGRRDDRHRRTAAQGDAGKNPDAEARLLEGRHGHRRQRLGHFRRRGGARADARVRSEEARPASRSRASSPRLRTATSRPTSPRRPCRR